MPSETDPDPKVSEFFSVDEKGKPINEAPPISDRLENADEFEQDDELEHDKRRRRKRTPNPSDDREDRDLFDTQYDQPELDMSKFKMSFNQKWRQNTHAHNMTLYLGNVLNLMLINHTCTKGSQGPPSPVTIRQFRLITQGPGPRPWAPITLY